MALLISEKSSIIDSTETTKTMCPDNGRINIYTDANDYFSFNFRYGSS